MKIISLLIILLNLTACNVYELVDQGNKISDEFELLLDTPRIELLTSPISLSAINSGGVDIYLKITNGNFINSGGVVFGPTAVLNGVSAGSLTSSTFTYIKSDIVKFNAINSSGDTTCSVDCSISINITAASYNSKNDLSILHDNFHVEITP